MLPFPIISQTPINTKAVPVLMGASEGETHMLTSTGRVYACGSWSYTYFGAPTVEWELLMQDVESLYPSQCSVSCSLLAKKKDGTWMIRGYNAFTNSYNTSDYNCTTQINALIAISPIKKIRVSGLTIGIQLQNGNLYFVGANNYSKFGINSSTTRYANFTLVASNVKDFDLRFSWASYLNTSNQLYSAGYSWNSTIGTATTGSYVATWTLQVSNVDTFWMRESTTGGTFVKLTNGTYQAKGVSHLSGALTTDTTTYTNFTPARTYSSLYIADNYSYALGADGKVYSCGISGAGATSQGTVSGTAITNLFTEVVSTVELTNKVHDIWVSGKFNAFIKLNDGTVLGTGRGAALYNNLPGYTTDQGQFVRLNMPYEL